MTVLPFTPGRVWLLAVPVTALIALSYLVNAEAWRTVAWWVYASLGFFYAVVLLMPLLLKHRAWLRLDQNGMHIKMLLREETFPWRDIESFATAELEHGPVPLVRFVGVNFRGKPPKVPALLAPLMQRMNGYHRSVPAWFGGLNADELCRLLDDWRQRT
jgi:hypothetical protein